MKRSPRYVVEIARRLRQRPTGAEEILWGCLRNRQTTGAKFRRQHPLGRYIADFYCQDARLAIELDGGIHECLAQAEYDAIRQEELEQRGVKVLRIKNAEVINDLPATLKKIVEALKTPSPPAPLPQGEG
ncbi:MAG: endonuclease domain-containing protein [Chloroflexi bacterium]|nr:endonuclease domain-containing protein [Chloroflexota bacterium]